MVHFFLRCVVMFSAAGSPAAVPAGTVEGRVLDLLSAASDDTLRDDEVI